MKAQRFFAVAAGVWLASCAVSPTLGNANQNAEGQPVATLSGHAAGVTGLAFGGDGRRIFSACAEDVRVWDATTGKELNAMTRGGRVVAFHPPSHRVAIASRENVAIYDVASGKELLTFDPHGPWDPNFPFRPMIAALAFSPDGARLATAGSVTRVGGPHGLPGGVVALWDATTGKPLHRFDKLSTGASVVTFSADGKMVAGGTNGAGGELPEPGEVWVWQVETGRVLQTIKTSPEAPPGEFLSAADVAFSPDGKQIAVAVSSGSRGRPAGLLTADRPSALRIWSVESGQEALTLQGNAASVARIAFRPDGKQLASAGSDRVVRLWDAATGKEVKAFPVNAARVEALAFSLDSQFLAAGAGGDNRPGDIQVWACPKE